MSDQIDYCVMDPKYASDLNHAIMRVVRPAQLASGYTTTKYCNVIAHPSNGADGWKSLEALCMPKNNRIPIHAESTCQELFDLFDLMVRDGVLTKDESGAMKTGILDKVGETVAATDIIPPSYKDQIKTYGEMDAMGWFPPDDPTK